MSSTCGKFCCCCCLCRPLRPWLMSLCFILFFLLEHHKYWHYANEFFTGLPSDFCVLIIRSVCSVRRASFFFFSDNGIVPGRPACFTRCFVRIVVIKVRVCVCVSDDGRGQFCFVYCESAIGIFVWYIFGNADAKNANELVIELIRQKYQWVDLRRRSTKRWGHGHLLLFITKTNAEVRKYTQNIGNIIVFIQMELHYGLSFKSYI